MKRLITLIDTACGSLNNGDAIIMQAAEEVITSLVENPEVFFYKVPSHARCSKEHKELLRKSVLKIVCGTNLFNLNYTPFYKSNPLKIGFKDLKLYKNTLFFGVGTTIIPSPKRKIGKLRRYINELYSKHMWRKILSHEILHSVRDQETFEILKNIGIDNVINTGCPTIWKLNPKYCDDIPDVKGENAVVTFTGYKSQKFGSELLSIVAKNYNKVYIWPQSIFDYKYIKSYLEETRVSAEIIPATLRAYDNLLESEKSIDYIGTRLHGGIRALQHKKRSIIIAIDSRAESFKRDFNLPVLNKNDLKELDKLINTKFKIKIALNEEAISSFKSTLKNYINNIY